MEMVHFTDTSTFKYIQDVVGDVNKNVSERITEPFNIFKYNEAVVKIWECFTIQFVPAFLNTKKMFK